MSTQMTFAQCTPASRFRPALVPNFQGDLYSNPHTQGRQACLSKEAPRRDDKLPIKFGSGTPSVNSTLTDVAGIAHAKPELVQNVSTMEGSVTLPVHSQQRAYMPSIAALNLLTHTADTRRQPHPERYYR